MNDQKEKLEKATETLKLKGGSERISNEACVQLKVGPVTGIPRDKYEMKSLHSAYVRILLDDDTFTTKFATLSPDGEGTIDTCQFFRLDWYQDDEDVGSSSVGDMAPIHVPIGNKRDIAATSVFLILCLNTQEEISFLDPMIANFEIKTHEYMD